MPIALIIATIFIGAYFYRSAENIGKNGTKWVITALGVFISAFLFVSLLFAFIFQYLLKFSSSSSLLLGWLTGLIAGIIGLAIVNYYLNIIHD